MMPHRCTRWLCFAAALILPAFPSLAFSQSISTSQAHVCAVGGRGDLHCWGTRVWAHGPRPIPMDSSGRMSQPAGVKIKQFETGWLHDCALMSDGIVYCAGVNSSGELGRAMYEPCPPIGCGLPGAIETTERFTSLTVGRSHSCALTASGVAYCWGENDAGQTGVGTRARVVDRPARVVGGYRFKRLAAGDRHTCGITLDGAMLCWGANEWGQLGSNPARRGCALTEACMAAPAPVDEPHTFRTLAAGYGKTCGLTADGALYCWGRFYSQIVGREPVKPTHIGATMPFVSVSPGYWFSCGIVRDGRAFCWREDAFATIGRDLVTWGCKNGDVCVDETPVGDREGLRFAALSSGEMTACGIATTGGVYCWGARDMARLGSSAPDCVLGKRDDAQACTGDPFRIGGSLDVEKAKR